MGREIYGYFLECGAGEMANLYKAAGQFKGRGYLPNPGDVIFYDWDGNGWPNHVGIVEAVNGVVLTIIEGNHYEVVARVTYAYNNKVIYGFGIPETTSGNRAMVLKQAQNWVGLKESDCSFDTIIDVYNSSKPLARGYKVKYTDEWCAAFVSACAIQAQKAIAAKDILYCVRLTFDDRASQLGSYKVLANAKKKADSAPGYNVYTYPDGQLVYSSKQQVEPKDIYHVVVKGDTLWKIATKYLGSGTKYRKIMDANNLVSTVIYVGQKLLIPQE